MDLRPIGVFDSGLGGLTVVKEIKRLLPNESIVYLGDTARVPYGTRSKKTVTEFSLQNIRFLLNKKVKCIVIACNTSSALAYTRIKIETSVPTFDVIGPGVRAALSNGLVKKIGVIGTRATIGSHAYKKAIHKGSSKASILEVACPLFVPLIEEGELKGQLIEYTVDKYLKPFIQMKIDILILGCTHYPLIKSQLLKKLKKIRIVDSGKTAAKELSIYLEKNKIVSSKNKKPRDEFFVTDLTDRFIKVAEMFLEESLQGKIKKVDIN